MTYSDSSSDSSEASSANAANASILQVGLTALRQKNYADAIVHLRQCQTSDDPSIRIKAQMGLAKAYLYTHQAEAAQQLCQILQTQRQPQVRDWATQMLREIDRDRSGQSQSGQPRTGQPLANRSQLASPQSTSSQSTPSQPTPSQLAIPIDKTGFTPLVDPGSMGPGLTDPGCIDPRSTDSPSTNTGRGDTGRGDTGRGDTGRGDTGRGDTGLAGSQPASTVQPSDSGSASRSTSKSTSASTAASVNLRHPTRNPSRGSLDRVTDRWRNAGRSSQWSSLGQVDISSLWGLEVGSIVLLFWLIRTSLQMLLAGWNWLSIRLSWITGLPRFLLPTDLTIFVLVVIGLVWLVSPWLLRFLLRAYPIQSFGLAELEQASPEAVRLLKRWQQGRRPIPQLERLDLAVPVIFSLGHSPWTTRIILSQGLLDQLAADEIATLIAAELGHIRHWDGGVITLIATLAQIPYQIYWRVANWGDRQGNRVLQAGAILVSAASYSLFWFLRLAGIWLSRIRLYYSDRVATEATGNPNGLTRSLLKLAIGTAQDIQQQQQTSNLLESLEMLLPVGYRSGLTIGSLYRNIHQGATLLDWERQNPARRWLAWNNPHPPLGDRLNLLTEYARHWRLPPELDWMPLTAVQTNPSAQAVLMQRQFGLQAAPFLGMPIGLGVALLLWGVGWLARQVRLFELSWLAGDRSILWACGLLGLSIGLFLRMNSFFPEINRSTVRDEPALENLMQPIDPLPIDAVPVRLSGRLIGRPGLQNRLYSDLILQTSNGLIRLHYTSSWGWLSDLFPRAIRPTDWIDRPVMITGWFRRGATPWIDVETIQLQIGTAADRRQGRIARSQHPIRSTLLAGLAAIVAIWMIFQGG